LESPLENQHVFLLPKYTKQNSPFFADCLFLRICGRLNPRVSYTEWPHK